MPDEMPSHTPDATEEERERLIASVVAAFLLLPEEEQALGTALLTARLAAYRDAYRQAATDAGAVLPPLWEVPDAVVAEQQAQATLAAQHIAATYARDLQAQAHAFLQRVPASARALRAHLTPWAKARAAWKSPQVGGYETGLGADAGTQDAIADVLDGTLTDAALAPLDYSQLLVAIRPDTALCTFCRAYAGQTFPFDDAPQVDWPAHQHCMHYAVVLRPDGTEQDL